MMPAIFQVSNIDVMHRVTSRPSAVKDAEAMTVDVHSVVGTAGCEVLALMFEEFWVSRYFYFFSFRRFTI